MVFVAGDRGRGATTDPVAMALIRPSDSAWATDAADAVSDADPPAPPAAADGPEGAVVHAPATTRSTNEQRPRPYFLKFIIWTCIVPDSLGGVNN